MPNLIDKSVCPPEVITQVLSLCRECIRLSREGKKLETAFIVSPDNLVDSFLEESELKLLQGSISDIGNDIIRLFNIVDGHQLFFEISTEGIIRGVRKLADPYTKYADIDDILCGITAKANAVIIRSTGNNMTIEFFYKGNVVAEETYIKKTGRWVLRNLSEIVNDLGEILVQNNVDEEMFRKVILTCASMSHQGKGCIFAIGKDNVLELTSPMLKIMESELKVSGNINNLSKREIINYAKEDGAIILDCNGNIKRICARLEPSGKQRGEVKTSSGTRHKSASDISAETEAIVVAVSDDGLITIYNGGKVIIEF